MSYEEYSRTIKSYSDWLRATSDVDGLRNYHKVYVELFPDNDDNGKIKENPEIRTLNLTTIQKKVISICMVSFFQEMMILIHL